VTEQEWLDATDPVKLWNSAKRRRYSLRKQQLCVVAYCEAIRALLTNNQQRSVDALCNLADGADTAADRKALKPCGPLKAWPGWAVNVTRYQGTKPRPESLVAAMVAGAHEVFGNPFRKVKFAPAWRTDTAVTLARQMYEAREFSAMPILADALQDAGCDNEDVLNHCRAAEQTHVRGCWVIDLVLEKK
jgi:hypothetical protein